MPHLIRDFMLLAVFLFGLESQAQKPPEISQSTLRELGKGTLVISGFGGVSDEQDGQNEGGETPSHSVVIVSAPGHRKEQRSFTYPSCEKLYQQIRKHFTAVQRGTPPWVLTVDFGLIRLGKKVVWDTTNYCINPEESSPSDSMEEQRALVSLVGPWLTVSYQYSDAMGGGPPYHAQNWYTVDLRSSVPKLQSGKTYATEALDETSLLEALKADSYVKGTLQNLQELKSAREVLDGLGETLSFAFYDFNERTGQAAVRIGFQESTCGMCPNETSQLGLWVKPKPELLPYLRAAKKGQGLLMKAGPIPFLP
jgi:hypothetical protein